MAIKSSPRPGMDIFVIHYCSKLKQSNANVAVVSTVEISSTREYPELERRQLFRMEAWVIYLR